MAHTQAHTKITYCKKLMQDFFDVFCYIYIYGAYPGAHQFNARFFLMFLAIYIYIWRIPRRTPDLVYMVFVAPAPPSQIKEETQIWHGAYPAHTSQGLK